jgi:putative phosphoribosyl transferase
MFRNRQDAGRRLASELAKLGLVDPIVLALPRGGVPVATEIALELNAPLDVVIVRKIGAPDNPELAVGAIVDGDPPDVVLNRDIVEAYDLDDDQLRVLTDRQLPELERRRLVYREGREPLSVAGKTAIVVDDGAATGATMKLALRSMNRRSPLETIAALPVAPPETVMELSREAGRVICISRPGRFLPLAYHYLHFPQLTDQEVIDLLRRFRPQDTGSTP